MKENLCELTSQDRAPSHSPPSPRADRGLFGHASQLPLHQDCCRPTHRRPHGGANQNREDHASNGAILLNNLILLAVPTGFEPVTFGLGNSGLAVSPVFTGQHARGETPVISCDSAFRRYHPVTSGDMEAPAFPLPECCPGDWMARKRLTDRTLKSLRPAAPGTR